MVFKDHLQNQNQNQQQKQQNNGQNLGIFPPQLHSYAIRTNRHFYGGETDNQTSRRLSGMREKEIDPKIDLNWPELQINQSEEYINEGI